MHALIVVNGKVVCMHLIKDMCTYSLWTHKYLGKWSITSVCMHVIASHCQSDDSIGDLSSASEREESIFLYVPSKVCQEVKKAEVISKCHQNF